MGTELAMVREAPALGLADLKEMAKATAMSGLFPQLKTPEAVLTLMMLAQAEGLHPIQALRRFDIVQGKVGMKADAMLGEFQQRGGTVDWHEVTAAKCSATFLSPGLAKPCTVTWTMEDAKRAGLAGKTGPWQQYPRQMLRARTISEGVRMAMPAVVCGLYTPEEVHDFTLARPVVVEAAPGPKAPAPMAANTAAPSAEHAALSIASTPPAPSASIQDTGPTDVPSEGFRDLVQTYRQEKEIGSWVPLDMEPKARREQLARIHILLKELGIDEAKYRARLVELFGIESAGLISERQADELVHKLELAKNKQARQKKRLEETTRDLQQSLSQMREPGSDDDQPLPAWARGETP